VRQNQCSRDHSAYTAEKPISYPSLFLAGCRTGTTADTAFQVVVKNRERSLSVKGSPPCLGVRIDRAGLNARGIIAHEASDGNIHVGIVGIDPDVGIMRIAEARQLFAVYGHFVVSGRTDCFACAAARAFVEIHDNHGIDGLFRFNICVKPFDQDSVGEQNTAAAQSHFFQEFPP
jgi:hypothetical protein